MRKATEAKTGRAANQKAKTTFKKGPHARTDKNAGRANGPLIPVHQVEVRGK
jgi:hypothetical protein